VGVVREERPRRKVWPGFDQRHTVIIRIARRMSPGCVRPV
jgi:hypothetical protein